LAEKKKAVFLDRDGTINRDVGYLYKIEDFHFIDGVPQLIRTCNQNGYLVIVVTNQSGIARGYYTKQDMDKLHRYINEQLALYGAHIDAFYYCPHHPAITGDCNCRKPKTGMLEQAIADWQIDRSKSLLIGDSPRDVKAGKDCGIKSYYIDEYLARTEKKQAGNCGKESHGRP